MFISTVSQSSRWGRRERQVKQKFVIDTFTMDISGKLRECRMWKREDAGDFFPL